MDFQIIVTAFFLLIGCLLAITGGIGVLRMPDFYTRLHPAGKSDTLAQIFIMTGLAIYSGFTLVSAKLILIMLFLLFTTPTATHAVAKAAHLSGIKPWKSGEPKR